MFAGARCTLYIDEGENYVRPDYVCRRMSIENGDLVARTRIFNSIGILLHILLHSDTPRAVCARSQTSAMAILVALTHTRGMYGKKGAVTVLLIRCMRQSKLL